MDPTRLLCLSVLTECFRTKLGALIQINYRSCQGRAVTLPSRLRVLDGVDPRYAYRRLHTLLVR
jgi:hypothetical protein